MAGRRESHDKREIAAPEESSRWLCEEKRAEARKGSLSAEYSRKTATTKSKFIPTLSERQQRVRVLHVPNLTTVAEDSLKKQMFFFESVSCGDGDIVADQEQGRRWALHFAGIVAEPSVHSTGFCAYKPLPRC